MHELPRYHSTTSEKGKQTIELLQFIFCVLKCELHIMECLTSLFGIIVHLSIVLFYVVSCYVVAVIN